MAEPPGDPFPTPTLEQIDAQAATLASASLQPTVDSSSTRTGLLASSASTIHQYTYSTSPRDYEAVEQSASSEGCSVEAA